MPSVNHRYVSLYKHGVKEPPPTSVATPPGALVNFFPCVFDGLNVGGGAVGALPGAANPPGCGPKGPPGCGPNGPPGCGPKGPPGGGKKGAGLL